MNQVIQALFAEESLFLCEVLPFEEVTVTVAHKLTRLGFTPKSVIVFAMPYAICGEEERNLSRYAVSRDYHAYAEELKQRLLPKLEAAYPEHAFRLFADNSPIDEREAAAKACLGVFGKSGLLLTERYGSYVFLGEILTDLPFDKIGEKRAFSVAYCRDCGRCLAACPKGEGVCLSALTQKKMPLSDEEKKKILANRSVWGCDICQDVCPYNRRREETPIAFFKKERIPILTSEILAKMSEEEFRNRAFAWRGRAVIERNLKLFEHE